MFGGEQSISAAQITLSQNLARTTFVSGFIYTVGIIRVAPFAFHWVQSLWM